MMLRPAWLQYCAVHCCDATGLMQEHRNIPYIVARLGLSNKQLFWGDVPNSEVRHGNVSNAMLACQCTNALDDMLPVSPPCPHVPDGPFSSPSPYICTASSAV